MSSNWNLFYENPMTTVDNYFFMDAVIDWSDNEDLGIIGKNVRNWLQKDTKPFYLHK